MTWRKSRDGSEWLGQTRAWFGPTDFPNEAEVGINGPTDSGPFNVSVQAEIYHPRDSVGQTIDAAEQAIREIWPNVPKEILKAFRSRKPLEMHGWTVEVFEHPDKGYTVGVLGTLSAVRN